ncbi:MAG: 30S ribosomal protein S4e [Candidatus Anstonellales archaeon]
MAKRGERRHMKRISASKVLPITDKKRNVFIKNPSPGKHSKHHGAPLVFVLREMLGVVSNAREARIILNAGKVHVDGRVVKDEGFPVGLMDVVSMPEEKKSFRILLDGKGRLAATKISEGENLKPLKIKNKITAGAGIFQLAFHDGRTMLTKDSRYKPGDSVLFELDKKKIIEYIKLAPGANCLITEGKHAGVRGKLKEIVERMGRKEAVLDADGKEIITLSDYLFPVPEGW